MLLPASDDHCTDPANEPDHIQQQELLMTPTPQHKPHCSFQTNLVVQYSALLQLRGGSMLSSWHLQQVHM